MTFGIGGQLMPRYLGRSTKPDEFQVLVDYIPAFSDDERLKATSEFGASDLTQKLQIHNFIGKMDREKAAAAKEKKRENERDQALRDTQSYLGFRTAEGAWNPQDESVAMLDTNQPPRCAPYKNLVFVCIDIELMETSQNIVTEVGISILDTDDIIGVAPGDGGRNWIPMIKSRHLWLNDYKHFRNHRFVKGCPERFNFGCVSPAPLTLQVCFRRLCTAHRLTHPQTVRARCHPRQISTA